MKEVEMSDGPPERLLPEPVVKDLTSLSYVTRWRLVKTGQFPAPVRLTAGRVGTPESQVRSWIAEKMAAAK
ncbi:MAG TPA: AlpA family phage regulatory protein [Phenylobacterium sp.]|uniref:helix-turn-helix transcriptional regulator n=1 Tax=Phenylobacterium sp. TaxID=1871053 RepID=UPI002C77D0DD|nr:AlpA family phage regulatory protein [Phenylobacterium sp.]HXA39653.1 AlpA family phage regulatory protein [Phenylobacterium sp.]